MRLFTLVCLSVSLSLYLSLSFSFSLSLSPLFSPFLSVALSLSPSVSFPFPPSLCTAAGCAQGQHRSRADSQTTQLRGQQGALLSRSELSTCCGKTQPSSSSGEKPVKKKCFMPIAWPPSKHTLEMRRLYCLGYYSCCFLQRSFPGLQIHHVLELCMGPVTVDAAKLLQQLVVVGS